MSDQFDSNSSRASYHLKQLTTIINECDKDMQLLKEENKLINNKYKQLEDKYNNLLSNYQNLQQKYEQLEKKLEENELFDEQVECQTDFGHSLDDKNNCLMPYEKTFIGDIRKSDILCDESTCGSTDGSIDVDLSREVDEVPDSLDSSQRDLNDFEDNDCIIVEQKLSNESLDEIPDSLTNSPITESERVEKSKDSENDSKAIEKKTKSTKNESKSIQNKLKSSNICNYFKVKEEKCERSIDDRNNFCIKEEKIDKSTDRNDFRVKEEKCKETDKLFDINTEKCEANSAVKTDNNVVINDRINIKREKKESVGSPPVKLVIKTLGPAVRKKDERKKLNGYTCKECEEYYKTRDLTEDELKERLKACSRHRAKWSPIKSPPHFWDTDFPSTPECIKRGLMLIDDKPSPYVTERRNKKSKQTKLDFNKI